MIIFGKQLFLHTLKHHKDKIIRIMLAKDVDKEIFSLINKSGIKIERVDTKKAQALARGGNHQGFLCEVEPYEFCEFKVLKNVQSLVMLFGISDVGNIGSIVRSCVGLGADGLIIANKQPLSDSAIAGIMRASSGAAYELAIAQCSDELSALNELKMAGFMLYATDMDGIDVREFAKSAIKPEKFALIMGSEGAGLSKKILNKCDKTLAIKMQNGFESLNVGVACALIFDRIQNG